MHLLTVAAVAGDDANALSLNRKFHFAAMALSGVCVSAIGASPFAIHRHFSKTVY